MRNGYGKPVLHPCDRLMRRVCWATFVAAVLAPGPVWAARAGAASTEVDAKSQQDVAAATAAATQNLTNSIKTLEVAKTAAHGDTTDPQVKRAQAAVDQDKSEVQKAAEQGATASGATLGSPISIGTLFGLSVPLFRPDTYAVRSNVVVKNHTAGGWDYLLPSVYVVPSVALWTRQYATIIKNGSNQKTVSGTKTFGVIIPAGLTSKGPNGQEISVGAGLSYGWTTASSAEVGVAAALVWSPFQALTDGQKQSLSSGGTLPQGEPDTIGTKLLPSITVGIYLMPTL